MLCAATLLAATVFAVASPVVAGRGPHAGGWKTQRASPGLGPKGACPKASGTLAPGRQLTFVYRVQRPFDVELLGEMRAARPGKLPIRTRDVFMVSAHHTSAAWASEMVARLRNRRILSGELFRCNRISTLNGVGTDGRVAREDDYRLGGNSRVWSLAPNWERPVFNRAYPDSAGSDNVDSEPEWSPHYERNVDRIKPRVQHIHGLGKKAGAVITGWRNRGAAWRYARLAKRTGLAFQIVELQEECLKGPDNFARRARTLMGMYRNAGVPTSTLGAEISFSTHPGTTSLHNDVTPERAARCTAAAYRARMRGFFLFAHPRGLRAYFAALPARIRS